MITTLVNFLFSPIADHVNYRLHLAPHDSKHSLEGDVPQPGVYSKPRLAARKAAGWVSRMVGIRALLIKKNSTVRSKVAKKDTAEIMKTIDYQKVIDLRAETLKKKQELDADPNDVKGAWKFLDIDLWIPVNLERVYRLGLQSSPPLDVLDISGGAGYFAYICRHFGHKVHTTDIDLWEEFNEMMHIFNLERSVLWVKPFTPVPSYGRRFDLITSFMIAFNFPGDEAERWGIKEWEYLLKDLEDNHLKEEGVIHLLLNPHPDGTWYSDELKNYFLGRGAKIEDAEVVFRKGPAA